MSLVKFIKTRSKHMHILIADGEVNEPEDLRQRMQKPDYSQETGSQEDEQKTE